MQNDGVEAKFRRIRGYEKGGVSLRTENNGDLWTRSNERKWMGCSTNLVAIPWSNLTGGGQCSQIPVFQG